MGNPLYQDDVGGMCWNAAKTWQIGWYDSHKLTIDPTEGDWFGTIIGIADFDNNPKQHPVVVKIETKKSTDQFIAFNRAIGVNRDNVEADDEVTIVETGGNGEIYSQSYLKAHLRQGETYTYPDWANSGKNLIVKANMININTGNNAGYAFVQVCLGACGINTLPPTPLPTPVPTPLPSPSPTHICEDSNDYFQIIKPDGKVKNKTCDWANTAWTGYRCKYFTGVKENCPSTCTNCCNDSTESFEVSGGKFRTCSWIAKKKTKNFCKKAYIVMKCPETCGVDYCVDL